MNFKLVDTNRYYLEGTNKRFLHIASIHKGLQEFIVMLDLHRQQVHFEEITGGHLRVIDDDNLFKDLVEFIQEKRLLDIQAGAPREEQPFTANK